MLDERTRRVACAYDEEARAYRDHWAPVLEGPGTRLLDELPLAGSRRVLDVGAGVGLLHEAIARRAPHAAVFAVDRSIGMLRLAPPWTGRAVMDGSELGFPDGTFDVATMAFVLFHFVSPHEALREVRRALVPGGAIGITTWNEPTRLPALDVVREELDRHGAPQPEGILAQHELMNTPAKVEALLRDAGFHQARVSMRPLGHQNSLDGFLARFTLRSLRLRLRALSAPQQALVLARCRERLAAMGPGALLDLTPVISAVAHAT